MASVYSGSYITISALEGRDSESGILNIRDDQSVKVSKSCFRNCFRPKATYIRPQPRHLVEILTDAALNQRAWVLQERILAPAILHYANDQMIWECRTVCASESGETRSSHPFLKLVADGTLFRHKPDSSNLTYDIWMSLVEDYCRRGLTFRSDKFSAISGLTRGLSQRDNLTEGSYMAGLWQGDILTGLMWTPGNFSTTSPLESEEHPLPSWGWACVEGRVYYHLRSIGIERHNHIANDSDLELRGRDSLPSMWRSLEGSDFLGTHLNLRGIV